MPRQTINRTTKRANRRFPELLVVDGATGAGKSTLLEFLRRECAGSVYVGAKLTDRPRRVTDSDWEFRFVRRIPGRLRKYSFESVGKRYAIDHDELRRVVTSGLCYSVTCTDPATIKLLHREFRTVVVFIYRPLTRVEIQTLMENRGVVSHEDVETRYCEVASVLTNYAKNICAYDYVLLNTGIMKDFENQARAILRECGFVANVSTTD